MRQRRGPDEDPGGGAEEFGFDPDPVASVTRTQRSDEDEDEDIDIILNLCSALFQTFSLTKMFLERLNYNLSLLI